MIYREKAEVNKTALNNWLGKLSENYQDEFKHYFNTTERQIIISEDSESVLINKTEFYKWLYDLPSNLQKVFEDSVGTQLLNETKYREEGYFVIPGVHYGNIFLSVQPMRGWESQMDFHTSDLSPPQQYIAYYKYLSQIYKTDAIIHMGTHGTLEWLPGRSLGLQSTDWPFQLTETPIVYPYIVSNPGEGMTAKERSFAQVLTHMTPVTASTSLYGDYVELNDAISRYESNKKAGANDNLEYYKDLILNLTEDLGYDQPDYMVVSEYLENYYIALNNEDENATEVAKKNS
jgi:cobaltochelatase CobN